MVPHEDNKFSALNGAVWSGGSFVYVPKGVEVPLPLQAYFRINGENTGQFERTLIVVDEGAKVHYIEGCTAPIYATDSLHVAVVEVIALPGSKVRYTTIQNWSNDVYNLVTKRAHAHTGAKVEWIDANTGSRKTVKFPSIYLRGEGASADIISVAVAGRGQHQDTGAKAIHLAPNTTSRIVSKSVSKDGGRATYRGQLKVAPGATGVVASVRCDALMLDDQSRSDTYPYIDIQEDDTTMTHEATVGKISADQIFYLMSRGLTENEAQNLVIQGFLEVFTKELPDGVRHRVQPAREAGDGGLARVTSTSTPSGEAVPASKSDTPGRPGRPAAHPPTSRSGFADRALAEALASERDEPRWLRAERIAAAAAFEALPTESNQLYTPYVDLRGAVLDEVRPWVRTASAPAAGTPSRLPDGVDGLIDMREDGVVALALSPAATAAGVTLETFGAALARDPDGFRGDLEGGHTLPENDKLAQLVRGFWSQGVRLVVPDRLRLAHPILVRWASGDPGRALITRTIVRLGAGADISLVEEQVPSGAEVECAAGETVPQGLFCGTTEVVLGHGCSPGSRRDPGPRAAPGRVPASVRAHRRRRLAPLGDGPARLATDPLAGGQPPRGRPKLRRAGRDRVRHRRAAVRPDQLHPSPRPGHVRQPSVQGRAARQRPVLHEGPDHDREVGDRDGFVPG